MRDRENEKTVRSRMLFCERSPITYKISRCKCIVLRSLQDLVSAEKFARRRTAEKLPVLVYEHKSLIRRMLGNVDAQLQENKAVNLALAAPKVTGILIKPGETFSFWKLVGSPSRRKGYKTGLAIKKGEPSQGIGGGMCQFTNLIHWMVLHTPLDIVEHHHHDQMDLFPDYGRQVPFGTGTSIYYNYLDYRVRNNTDQPFQLIVYTTQRYLCGEIRTTQPLAFCYHIKCEDEFFSKEEEIVYRNNKIYRITTDKKTGNIISKERIKTNHARVMYDTSDLLIFEGKDPGNFEQREEPKKEV